MIETIQSNIQSFVDFFYSVDNAVKPHFKPLADVLYIPCREFATATGLNETLSTLFVTFQIAFLLSFGFNFLTRPIYRKWYSTLTGLFLGFYFHGLGYTICIFQFCLAYPCMVYMKRKHAHYAAVTLVSIVMTIRSFFTWWETILDGAPRL